MRVGPRSGGQQLFKGKPKMFFLPGISKIVQDKSTFEIVYGCESNGFKVILKILIGEVTTLSLSLAFYIIKFCHFWRKHTFRYTYNEKLFYTEKIPK